MNERFELAPDKRYSDTIDNILSMVIPAILRAISSRCRGRALAGWHLEEDAMLKLHSR